MPGMDGIGVLQALRARPDTQLLPVVLWTSNSNLLFIERGLRAGASAYHIKPTNLDEYRAQIDAIVQRWLQFTDSRMPKRGAGSTRGSGAAGSR